MSKLNKLLEILGPSQNSDQKQSGEGQNPPGENNGPAPGKTLRLLAICVNRKTLNTPIAFLKRRGYNVMLAGNMMEALKSVQLFRPHVIMMSWHLPKTNIPKMYHLFSKVMRLKCIVYTEESGVRTSAALMASGIPDTLLAPISGPGIHMRIQSMLRKKVPRRSEKKAKKRPVPVVSPNAQQVSKDDVPTGTVWDTQNVDQSLPENERVWNGTYTDSDGKQSIYHFKGPKAPKYDATTSTWEADDNGYFLKGEAESQNAPVMPGEDPYGTVMEYGNKKPQSEGASGSEENPEKPGAVIEYEGASGDTGEAEVEELNSEEFGSLVDDLEASANYDYSATGGLEGLSEDLSLSEDNPVPPDKEAPAAEVTKLQKTAQNPNKLSRMAYELRSVVESVLEPEVGVEADPNALVSSVAAMVIESSKFKGILVASHVSDLKDEQLLDTVFKKLQIKMKTFGEPIRNVTPILEIPCPELNFLAWANKRADYVITSQHGNEIVSFAFVPLQSLPEAIPTSAESVLAVSLQNDVSGDSVLLFDLFIYMEKNNKYLKYLKKGTILSQATYDKLLKFGVEKIYINKDDLEKFYAYCARNKLFAA